MSNWQRGGPECGRGWGRHPTSHHVGSVCDGLLAVEGSLRDVSSVRITPSSPHLYQHLPSGSLVVLFRRHNRAHQRTAGQTWCKKNISRAYSATRVAGRSRRARARVREGALAEGRACASCHTALRLCLGARGHGRDRSTWEPVNPWTRTFVCLWTVGGGIEDIDLRATWPARRLIPRPACILDG